MNNSKRRLSVITNIDDLKTQSRKLKWWNITFATPLRQSKKAIDALNYCKEPDLASIK